MTMIIDVFAVQKRTSYVAPSTRVLLNELAWEVDSSCFLDAFRILTAYTFLICGIFLRGSMCRFRAALVWVCASPFLHGRLIKHFRVERRGVAGWKLSQNHEILALCLLAQPLSLFSCRKQVRSSTRFWFRSGPERCNLFSKTSPRLRRF